MPEPEDTLRNSPVDFDSAVAYALHSEMRRLIILYVVGTLVLPIGFSMYITPGGFGAFIGVLPRRLLGLVLVLVGATFFFAGIVGAAFKLVADANILAEKHYGK